MMIRGNVPGIREEHAMPDTPEAHAEDEATVALERLDELEQHIADIDERAPMLALQINNPYHPNRQHAQLAAEADARLRAQWVAEFEALVRYLTPDPGGAPAPEPAPPMTTERSASAAEAYRGPRLDVHA
jgi:hypothetical protein